jgi:hypothetical protein
VQLSLEAESVFLHFMQTTANLLRSKCQGLFLQD